MKTKLEYEMKLKLIRKYEMNYLISSSVGLEDDEIKKVTKSRKNSENMKLKNKILGKVLLTLIVVVHDKKYKYTYMLFITFVPNSIDIRLNANLMSYSINASIDSTIPCPALFHT